MGDNHFGPPGSGSAMSNFRPINRDTGFLLPPSVDEWLPQRHLARFVVEVVDRLDLSALEKAYRGSGSASYHPAMLLSLLIYGYATKVFSSRALERASYDSVAVRFIAGNEHPDHDTIAGFRKRFLGQIEPLFVEVLKLARAMGMLRLGTVALDGTKVHANASRHSALSYGHAKKLEKQQTPEPVFGSIKSAMGFRQFLLRGLPNVQGEWNLVAMSWNIKRMFALQPV